MKTIILFLFPFLTFGQHCDHEYTYVGDPGDIYIDSFEILPGSEILIDYCTYNVPDDLIIDVPEPNSDIRIIIGAAIPITWQPPYYHGYTQLRYEDGEMQTQITNSTFVPTNIGCTVLDNHPGGIVRLRYIAPINQCTFRWMVAGNVVNPTVYDICINVIKVGEPIVDTTVYRYHCNPNIDTTHIISECNNITIIPIYDGIETKMHVTNSKCYGDFKGKIEFDNYPQFNLYNLDTGTFKITVQNQHCKKEFKTTLIPINLCNWYVPNVFSPNWDGLNDEFIFFTPSQIDYNLWIFDRWGELIFKGSNLKSNSEGWDGTFKNEILNPDVFVYRIKSKDIDISGDITLIR